jgi:hypothetical protein
MGEYRIPNMINSSFNHRVGCSLLISFNVKWCWMRAVDVGGAAVEVSWAAVATGCTGLGGAGVGGAGIGSAGAGGAGMAVNEPPRLMTNISCLI